MPIFGVRNTTRVEPSKPHRTKTGKVLADADIETLAAEVEHEYDVACSRRAADHLWDQLPRKSYPSDSTPN
jgi:hypothetical protein